MANVAGSIGSPKSTVTVTDAALVGESASVDRVGPGVVLSKVTRSTLDAVLLLSGNVHDAVGGDHGSHLAVGASRQGKREVLVGRGVDKVLRPSRR